MVYEFQSGNYNKSSVGHFSLTLPLLYESEEMASPSEKGGLALKHKKRRLKHKNAQKKCMSVKTTRSHDASVSWALSSSHPNHDASVSWALSFSHSNHDASVSWALSFSHPDHKTGI